ncbi:MULTISPECIES: hypothetical protein, partial [unclassified Pseudomonas]|uniref:hypothetical protein n=1 Tax=unclassified Pseudomonas TaxID=196821 RepID=UPI001C48F9F7
CRKLRNSLFTKEFSVSTAPEVGRIIDIYNLPSSTDSVFLSPSCRMQQNDPKDTYIEEPERSLYIEELPHRKLQPKP